MKYYTISQSALTILTSERADHLEDSSTPIWNILPDHLEDSSRSARARHIKQYTEKQTEKQKPLPLHKGDEEKVEELFSNEQSSVPSSPMIANRSAMASRSKAIPENIAVFQTRANRLLGRRDSTKWAANEIKAAANWIPPKRNGIYLRDSTPIAVRKDTTAARICSLSSTTGRVR